MNMNNNCSSSKQPTFEHKKGLQSKPPLVLMIVLYLNLCVGLGIVGWHLLPSQASFIGAVISSHIVETPMDMRGTPFDDDGKPFLQPDNDGVGATNTTTTKR